MLTLPAGSLRCERFVKSSLASRIEGFIRGGKVVSLSSWRVARFVVIVLDYSKPHVSLRVCELSPSWTHLSIDKLKDQLDLVSFDGLLLHLRGDPTLCRVGLPRLGADIVGMGHGGVIGLLLRSRLHLGSKSEGHPRPKRAYTQLQAQ